MLELPENLPRKFCRVCGIELNSDSWYPSSKKKNDYMCKSCQRKKAEKYYKEHRDAVLRKQKETNRKFRLKLKLDVISHYSPKMMCQECGFNDIRALTIDHIYGGGTKHRKSIGSGSTFYRWLRDNDYPSGFQVLCMNCQFIKKIEKKEHGK